MSLCIAVTSGKGGTGKSTVSAGLTLALSKMGKSVLLVDMDEGLRCLDLMLGVDESVVFDLSDVIAGRPLGDAVYPIPETEQSFLLPAPRKLGTVSPEALSDLSEKAASVYDAVIFDFPAGIDFSLYPFLGNRVHYIAVCNPDPISVRDASEICGQLPTSLFPPRLILNKFKKEYVKKGVYKNIDDIIDISGFQLLGIVPDCTELSLLPVNHSLSKRSKAFLALTRIAGRLCGDNIKLPSPAKI